MPSVTCTCGKVLNYKPEHEGKKAQCSNCQQVVVLEEVTEVEVVEEVEERPQLRKPRLSGTDSSEREERDSRSRRSDFEEEPRRSRKRREEEDDLEEGEEKPRHKKKATAPVGFLPRLAALMQPALFWIVAVPVVLGGVLAFYGFNEYRLGNVAKAEPRTVKLADLITNGPGDNAHVIITDYLPDENIVFTYRKSKFEITDGSNKPWNEAYMPLHPNQGGAGGPGMPGMPGMQPTTGPVRFILKTTTAKNKGELDSIIRAGRIQGVIINSIASLGSEVSKLLRESYPTADLNSVLILEANRKPSPPTFGLALAALGAVLVLIGGGLGVIGLVFRP